jgi:hypothetical protein
VRQAQQSRVNDDFIGQRGIRQGCEKKQ